MSKPETVECELAVIGAGMAGMAAALFAANRGISTVQCGHAGGLIFASGLLDLLGRDPMVKTGILQDPWKGIRMLRQSEPDHPYAVMDRKTIAASLFEFVTFSTACGLPFSSEPDSNSTILSALGTTKPTYYVPQSMWSGVAAVKNRQPCLIVGFKGLKEYSAHQIYKARHNEWPGLRAIEVVFPGTEGLTELYPEHLARALEVRGNRVELAALIKEQLNGEIHVGLPAVLGIHKTSAIIEEMENFIGASIFEIPTPLVSVSGMRIKEMFERQLPRKNVRSFWGSWVEGVESSSDNGFRLSVNYLGNRVTIDTSGIILASGRFLGQGLVADRIAVREAIFDLPVLQPVRRNDWHRSDFFDARGHPINRGGLAFDKAFRPLDHQGQPAFKRLFAAGSILANQDWIREQSGSGIAIATAYSAVNAYIDQSNQQG